MAEFRWSQEQLRALDAISEWQRRRGQQIFRLFGFAGTGKTTITKEIARRMKGDVLFCALTGKAALVLRNMGCDDAMTVHSAIYTPLDELIEEANNLKNCIADLRHVGQFTEKAYELAKSRWGTVDLRELEERLTMLRKRIEAGPQWILRDELKLFRSNGYDDYGEERFVAIAPDLVILDECSMINEELAEDLLSFGKKIIVIGDPYQLPPIDGQGYFLDEPPDAMLKEVHRQARDNPIIAMATKVREYGSSGLSPGVYGGSSYVRKLLPDGIQTFLEADQVLCGTHRTRHTCNDMIREAKGFGGLIPTIGEKIICCRNASVGEVRILNGSMWRVISCTRKGSYFEAQIEPWDRREGTKDLNLTVAMHREPFGGGKPFPEDRFKALEFDWGYCITVHKAQGSQWPHVAVINDCWDGADNFRDHWTYTAITRAQERVSIIKPLPKPKTPRKELSLANMKPRGLANRRAPQ